MSSKRKLESARANGAKSHGPVTEEGRKKSSMNALTHGLNARTVVLPNENQDEYDFLLVSYVERFQPADLVEMDLVVEMDKQKEQLDKTYGSYTAPVAFRALSDSGHVANLNRVQSQLEPAYTHALPDLLRIQQLRHSAERTQSQERTPTEPRASASAQSQPDSKPPGPTAIRGLTLTKKFRSGKSPPHELKRN